MVKEVLNINKNNHFCVCKFQNNYYKNIVKIRRWNRIFTLLRIEFCTLHLVILKKEIMITISILIKQLKYVIDKKTVTKMNSFEIITLTNPNSESCFDKV